MNTYSLLQTLTIEDAASKINVPARVIFQWLAEGDLPGYVDQPHGLGEAQLTASAIRSAFKKNDGKVRLYIHENEPDTFADYDQFIRIEQIMIKPSDLDAAVQKNLSHKLEVVRPDFSILKYGLKQFNFNPDQAKVIQRLYEGAKRGTPDLSSADLINSTGIERSEDRIDKILRSQKNKILGVLVINGDRRGTYRLAPFLD